MKLFISADMEGIAGVVTEQQLVHDGFEYERYREFMTLEIAAACEAAFEKQLLGVLKNDPRLLLIGHDLGSPARASQRNLDDRLGRRDMVGSVAVVHVSLLKVDDGSEFAPEKLANQHFGHRFTRP